MLDKSRYRSQFTIPPDASGLNSCEPTHGLYSNDGRSIDADEELLILSGGARTINLTPAPSPLASVGSKNRNVPVTNSDGSAIAPNAQNTSNTEAPKGSVRGSGLFAVDSSVQSVFYSSQQRTSKFTLSPPAQISNNHGVDIQGPLNFISNNLGIGTGADAMATPPAKPKIDAPHQPGAAGSTSPWLLTLAGGQLPTLPPPSDPLALLSLFCETSVPPSVQEIFRTCTPGNGGADTDGVGSAMNMDAGMNLETFEASNMSFDFLMDDMLSARSASGGGSQGQPQPQNAQSIGYSGYADGTSAWHALLGQMEALQNDVNPDSGAFQDLAHLQ